MTEEWSTSNHGNNLKSTLVIVIVAICVISVAVWTLASGWALPSVLTNEQQFQPDYTTSYTTIDPKTAYEFVFNNSNPLTIVVDIRPCDCSYNKGHIPNAIWQTSPMLFYETANNLLIYCEHGELSVTFCEDLLNHTYGAIYYLEGGIEAWIDAGYRVTKL